MQHHFLYTLKHGYSSELNIIYVSCGIYSNVVSVLRDSKIVVLCSQNTGVLPLARRVFAAQGRL